MENEQFTHLLQRSTELFMKHGVKNLTMDDIAKELGISKKTIYRFVDNKSDLVKLTMKRYLDNERVQVNTILSSSKNAIDGMIQMISYFFNQVRDFNPMVMSDLQKYYPETWDLYNDYRFHFMLKSITDNLNTGLSEGIYRDALNTDVISKVYIAGIDILTNQDLFPGKKYRFIDTYREYMNYHLRGIVSSKGLKYLEQHNLFKS